MEPNRREFQKQCAFQSFCKRVLHNEACNAHEEIRRRRAKEVSFSDLALHEERQLYTLDKYFQDEEAEPSYQQAGKKITPKLLLEAIRTLPEEKRKAIMLYYFEGMTDVEIGKMFNTSRSTIQYRRTSSFEQLRKYYRDSSPDSYLSRKGGEKDQLAEFLIKASGLEEQQNQKSEGMEPGE